MWLHWSETELIFSVAGGIEKISYLQKSDYRNVASECVHIWRKKHTSISLHHNNAKICTQSSQKSTELFKLSSVARLLRLAYYVPPNKLDLLFTRLACILSEEEVSIPPERMSENDRKRWEQWMRLNVGLFSRNLAVRKKTYLTHNLQSEYRAGPDKGGRERKEATAWLGTGGWRVNVLSFFKLQHISWRCQLRRSNGECRSHYTSFWATRNAKFSNLVPGCGIMGVVIASDVDANGRSLGWSNLAFVYGRGNPRVTMVSLQQNDGAFRILHGEALLPQFEKRISINQSRLDGSRPTASTTRGEPCSFQCFVYSSQRTWCQMGEGTTALWKLTGLRSIMINPRWLVLKGSNWRRCVWSRITHDWGPAFEGIIEPERTLFINSRHTFLRSNTGQMVWLELQISYKWSQLLWFYSCLSYLSTSAAEKARNQYDQLSRRFSHIPL